MGNCIIELFWEMVGRGGDGNGIASYPGVVAQLQRGRQMQAAPAQPCGQTTGPRNVTDFK